MSPVGKAINELLENPSPEAATALVSRLPSLLPDDPAMASILAEAMAKEFSAPSPAPSAASDDAAKLANTTERERQAKNKEHGVAAMSELANGKDCLNFMQSQSLGRIAFYQGNDNEGYLHIKNNPDPAHQAMLKDYNIPNTLAYGKYYKDTYQKFSGWSAINNDKCVFLGKDGDGVKIITAYISKSKAAVFARRTAIENKEV